MVNTHKISIYQISWLRDFDKSDFKFEEIKHDFIYDGIKKSAKFMKCKITLRYFKF